MLKKNREITFEAKKEIFPMSNLPIPIKMNRKTPKVSRIRKLDTFLNNESYDFNSLRFANSPYKQISVLPCIDRQRDSSRKIIRIKTRHASPYSSSTPGRRKISSKIVNFNV